MIANRSAVDRGLFVSTLYRTFREQVGSTWGMPRDLGLTWDAGGGVEGPQAPVLIKLLRRGWGPRQSVPRALRVGLLTMVPSRTAKSLE